MSTRIEQSLVKHKFRDLKVYCSTEWLADNKKKYRQVFDRYETSYVYAELSFYNKNFDLEDWDIHINLKCFSIKKGRKEIANLHFDRKISKYDNVVYVREGWGNKKNGTFWKRGAYFWEAYLDGVKVATKYFYVEETNKLYPDIDSYLSLRAVKLYEAPYDDLPKENRVYYKTFSTSDTRYVFTEIHLENRMPQRTWHCELLIKFYNGARELKGQMVRLHRVEKDQFLIEINANLGSNIKGSWREDDYTAEIVFLDKVLGVVPFKVETQFEEGLPAVVSPFRTDSGLRPVIAPLSTEGFDDVMKHFDELIGLESIKTKIREHARYLQFVRLRKNKGFLETDELNIHAVFFGNPGTGKTTVAKMMGKLYKQMGLLSKGHIHEVDRSNLIGEYIGQTAPKVKDAIDKARGGVLFIDEAYALARSADDTKDFGREVIELLVKEMSEGGKDLAVIVAGYPKEMKGFLESNPGLKSRFKIFYDFQDYLPQELSAIAHVASRKKEVTLAPPAFVRLEEAITNAYRKRTGTFGNARFVYDLVEFAKINMALRIMETPMPETLDKEELSTIILDDIEKINIDKPRRIPNIPIDEKQLARAIAELDGLIGMKNVRDEIKQTVQLVRYYRETNRDVLNRFFLHTVFIGNPGTGKTTVARILTRIYKALGILERGHIVETDRQGLVAGFVGQTAIKTSEKIDESMGGVLFIDEAYALTDSPHRAGGDFGSEAIQTLLKRMEDNRGEFFIFAAGYPENMENFLKANPGLRSRFDKTLKFEDYSPEELNEIAVTMLKEEGLSINPDAATHLHDYLNFLHEYRDKYFGNARTVRGIVSEVAKRHSLRLSELSKSARKEAAATTVTLEDVTFLIKDKSEGVFTKKKIGF